jgi:hypothetical protein
MTSNATTVSRTILPSGLTVLVETLPYFRSVAFGYYLRSGSAVESEEPGRGLPASAAACNGGTPERTYVVDVNPFTKRIVVGTASALNHFDAVERHLHWQPGLKIVISDAGNKRALSR